MERCFNTTGACDPRVHYMIDIRNRLAEIKELVNDGKYFTINRARQYGKTTTIHALTEYLAEDYIVLSLDFQMLGTEDFLNECNFSTSFAEYLLDTVRNPRLPVTGLNSAVLDELNAASDNGTLSSLRKLFRLLSKLCDTADKPIVLIIDEVDSATNNQVFLDFLAQLRSYYLTRRKTPSFHSVILAGVYDIKNIRYKIRPDEDHKMNSPWNIAADFKINMSFSQDEIAGMLCDYETDYRTGMDINEISRLIYDYTSGYPFLVSRLCKLIDEDIAGSKYFPDRSAAWVRNGLIEAVKLLLSEKNTLFESLMGKILNIDALREVVYSILFSGERIVYNPDSPWLDLAMMYGFVRNLNGTVAISNRIFEMRLYNYFLSTAEAQSTEIFRAASQDKNQFIYNGHLNMEMVLEKFVQYFGSIYGDHPEEFDEEEGRRRFLLYLRPIINGTGNYYIEAQTRNARRMDVVVDYNGEQFIIELKIWRGSAYHERGEQQLADYLDYFHLDKGYMLSYNFNQKKQPGIRTIHLGERVLVEATV